MYSSPKLTALQVMQDAPVIPVIVLNERTARNSTQQPYQGSNEKRPQVQVFHTHNP